MRLWEITGAAAEVWKQNQRIADALRTLRSKQEKAADTSRTRKPIGSGSPRNPRSGCDAVIWIVVTVAIVGAYWWWTLSQKSLPFWKLVSAHPSDALSFFNRNPHCHWEKSKGQDLVGPFTFVRPDGQSVPLYIDADHIERVQGDFVELIVTKSGAGRGR